MPKFGSPGCNAAEYGAKGGKKRKRNKKKAGAQEEGEGDPAGKKAGAPEEGEEVSTRAQDRAREHTKQRREAPVGRRRRTQAEMHLLQTELLQTPRGECNGSPLRDDEEEGYTPQGHVHVRSGVNKLTSHLQTCFHAEMFRAHMPCNFERDPTRHIAGGSCRMVDKHYEATRHEGGSLCSFVSCGQFCRLHTIDRDHSNLSLRSYNGELDTSRRRFGPLQQCADQSTVQNVIRTPKQRKRKVNKRKRPKSSKQDKHRDAVHLADLHENAAYMADDLENPVQRDDMLSWIDVQKTLNAIDGKALSAEPPIPRKAIADQLFYKGVPLLAELQDLLDQPFDIELLSDDDTLNDAHLDDLPLCEYSMLVDLFY